MKKILLAGALMIGLGANAQDLPQPSPSAEVHQRIGLSDVTIKYSRPSMKDRDIFGELVPYNEMWRTGANANTTIEFSTPVVISGQEVPKGKYSLFTIPRKGEWTIILNRKTDMWGTGNYNEEHDVLRTTANVNEGMMHETFTIAVKNLYGEGADLSLAWADKEVLIPMNVEVTKQAMKNIETALADKENDQRWMVLRNAANYHFNTKGDMGQALEYMNESIDLHEDSWYSYYLKAEIQAEMGQMDQAVDTAEMALEMGQKAAEASDSEFGYAKNIQKSIKQWQES